MLRPAYVQDKLVIQRKCQILTFVQLGTKRGDEACRAHYKYRQKELLEAVGNSTPG
jgi:hypothetical protein